MSRTTQEHSFFQAMLDEPDNVELRMVIADWYESHGDPRADFIRVQLALHELPNPHVWREEMEARQSQLFHRHRRRWNAPIHRRLNESPLKRLNRRRRGSLRGWGYRRGFIEVIRIQADAFLQHADLIFSLGPIRLARLFGAEQSLGPLLASPHLKRLAGIDLSHNAIGNAGVIQISASPRVAHFTELNLTGVNISDEGISALIKSPYLTRLKRLTLSQNTFSYDAICQLSTHFGEVAVHENGDLVGKRMWSRLARTPKQESHVIEYDDRVCYEDGQMYDSEGRHRDPAENLHDLTDEWYEGADFNLYAKEDEFEDAPADWMVERGDTDSDEDEY